MDWLNIPHKSLPILRSSTVSSAKLVGDNLARPARPRSSSHRLFSRLACKTNRQLLLIRESSASESVVVNNKPAKKLKSFKLLTLNQKTPISIATFNVQSKATEWRLGEIAAHCDEKKISTISIQEHRTDNGISI